MLKRLHAHRAWANQRIIDWYLALPQPDEYCLKMLSHILLAEETWLRRMRGEAGREVWQLLVVEELNTLREINDAGWRDALQTDLSRVVRYRRLNDVESESSLGDIATHVCTHGVYHRGQIAAQATRKGWHCPPSDFIVFARLTETPA